MVTPKMYLIVCPLLFLAGLIDAVGGGGGLLSQPAFLLAGLPYPMASGCSKLSCSFGITLSTVRFLKKGFLNVKLAVPTIFAAMLGSSIGAKIMLQMDNGFMETLMLFFVPITALVVMAPSAFRTEPRWKGKPSPKVWASTILITLVMGVYCGFYGPGSGTFLILAFTMISGMSTPQANAHTKVINLTANITALTVLLQEGSLPIMLGLAGAVCHMAGSYIGSGIAIKNNVKVTRSIVLVVLCILYLRILGVF